jgi:hypothetical protein
MAKMSIPILPMASDERKWVQLWLLSSRRVGRFLRLGTAIVGDWDPPTSGRSAAMATVYLVTAGSADTYRVERVYLDRDEAYGFAAAYNGVAPIEPVHVEEWASGAPPGDYDGPYWRAQWWARVPVSKRRGELRRTGDGERFDDFEIRQEWWTGDALPDAKVVRRELAGVPKVEVVGRSKEKVEELFWETITQVRADLAGVSRK